MPDRITASFIKAKLEDHLQTHTNKLDPKLHNHQIILFGEKGDQGACATLKDHERRLEEMEKLKTELSNLKWAIFAAIVIQIVMKFITIPV